MNACLACDAAHLILLQIPNWKSLARQGNRLGLTPPLYLQPDSQIHRQQQTNETENVMNHQTDTNI